VPLIDSLLRSALSEAFELSPPARPHFILCPGVPFQAWTTRMGRRIAFGICESSPMSFALGAPCYISIAHESLSLVLPFFVALLPRDALGNLSSISVSRFRVQAAEVPAVWESHVSSPYFHPTKSLKSIRQIQHDILVLYKHASIFHGHLPRCVSPRLVF
jgi:hypothetical protein